MEEEVLHHNNWCRRTGGRLLPLVFRLGDEKPCNSSSPRRMVRKSICATAAIEGRASPRKPMVWAAEVGRSRNLARGMALESHTGIGGRHTVTVVDHLDERTPGILQALQNFSARHLHPQHILTSSFITEAGRLYHLSATIWFATESGSSLVTSLFALTNLLNIFRSPQSDNQKNMNSLYTASAQIVRATKARLKRYP